jgi:hypothetical protein
MDLGRKSPYLRLTLSDINYLGTNKNKDQIFSFFLQCLDSKKETKPTLSIVDDEEDWWEDEELLFEMSKQAISKNTDFFDYIFYEIRANLLIFYFVKGDIKMIAELDR